MSKIYNQLPSEILDKLYNGNTLGYSEEEIAEIEARTGTKLPEVLRHYYLNYGKLDISTCLDSIREPESADFTYNWFDEEKEDYEETYETTIEELKASTKNYFVFWSENQGMWNAGVLHSDMLQDNPCVYMTTNDDLLEWAVASNNMQSFLLSMIWGNTTDCDDFTLTESENEAEINAYIEKNTIDKTKLVPTYNTRTTTCWDDEQKKLFMFIKKSDRFTEMRMLAQNKG